MSAFGTSVIRYSERNIAERESSVARMMQGGTPLRVARGTLADIPNLDREIYNLTLINNSFDSIADI